MHLRGFSRGKGHRWRLRGCSLRFEGVEVEGV